MKSIRVLIWPPQSRLHKQFNSLEKLAQDLVPFFCHGYLFVIKYGSAFIKTNETSDVKQPTGPM